MITTLPSAPCSETVDAMAIASGDIQHLRNHITAAPIANYALDLINHNAGGLDELRQHVLSDLSGFVKLAKAIKTEFTNSSQIRMLMEAHLRSVYNSYLEHEILYDLPRLRLIPTSSILSSGISYNYRPHRDTWYGGRQEQINHWMAVSNVTPHSTFFIAPSLFSTVVPNSSSAFDLDKWIREYSQKAELSVQQELRPHPTPFSELSNSLKIPVILQPMSEVIFCGHHVHGSLENKTQHIRVSIDYRVFIPSLASSFPPNIDSSATGDYTKTLVRLQ